MPNDAALYGIIYDCPRLEKEYMKMCVGTRQRLRAESMVTYPVTILLHGAVCDMCDFVITPLAAYEQLLRYECTGDRHHVI
jgi:hypothetical protein